ncbi:PAP2 superfamily protein [Acetitomaculum ruminis DSM 5522]|uniref:PAP2 superfamily protein n=1 Tax=Acetitomaculum ruminis DSM 5522 TaxID=1120918 RepID=A0A1I0YKG2_9FIRM|nr:phosphatase PAP2 family protein [Acetitomaculum ruminis]SFB13397.1 PAP2 superfamily protein [Acetitomaculum ruminis DSM 5522]
MNEEYLKKYNYIINKPGLKKAIIVINKILTAIVYGAYLSAILYLAIYNRFMLIKFIVIPGISFLIITIIRKKINAPRPYELLGIKPIIDKNTKGHSFPSRHVFSVFVIATVFLDYCLIVGILLIIDGILLAYVRVIGGVHFTKDVLAGALSGIVFGSLIFLI